MAFLGVLRKFYPEIFGDTASVVEETPAGSLKHTYEIDTNSLRDSALLDNRSCANFVGMDLLR